MLRKRYGPGRWRKLKGIAKVEFDGERRTAEVHWYEAHGVGRVLVKFEALSDGVLMPRAKRKYVVCLKSKGYEGALERKKIYVALGDVGAEGPGLIRMVDESGGDYLYKADRFAEIELPLKVARAIGAPV